jgi:hypothetical protein
MELAEDESNAQWTDELLEKLKGARGLTLMIEVYNSVPYLRFRLMLIVAEGQQWKAKHPLGGQAGLLWNLFP